MDTYWRQSEFWQREIDDPEFIQKLDSQIGLLVALDQQRTEASSDKNRGSDTAGDETSKTGANEESPEPAADVSHQLDTRLLRTACGVLRRALSESTIHDAGILLADSVSDTVGVEKCQKNWHRWLMAARCWPGLAVDHWQRIQDSARSLVKARLEKEGGTPLDGTVLTEILAGIRQLNLADVVSEATLRKAFSENDASSEEEGDREVEDDEGDEV